MSTCVLVGCVCLLTDFECAFAVRPRPGGCVLCWLPVRGVELLDDALVGMDIKDENTVHPVGFFHR